MVLTDKIRKIKITPTPEQFLVIDDNIIFTLDSPDLLVYLGAKFNEGFFII